MDKKNNKEKPYQPLISIVVPIYKVEKYLRKCIDSLINQTYRQIEILLVDDGSPDACPQICDEYSMKYSNVHVIHKPNGGLVSARKAGIKSANGEYICYVDGDDWISDEHIEQIALEINKTNADIIIHEFTVASIDTTFHSEHKMEAGYYDKQGIINQIMPTMLSTKPFYTFAIAPSLCSKAYRRSLLYPFQMSVPNSLTLGEDAAVSYPVILAANDISIIKEYGYMYRVNSQSMTRSYNEKLPQNIIAVIQYLYSWMIGTEYVTTLLPQLQDYACYMFLEAFSNEVIGNQTSKNALFRLETIIDYGFIKESIKRRETPRKIKIIYLVVKFRLRILFGFFRRYRKS